MASSHQKLKAYFILTAMLLFFIQISSAEEEGDDLLQFSSVSLLHQRRLLTYDCPGKCGGRCSRAGNGKRCMQECMICCNQCQCVPPGTVGNKEVCPCYANLKNSKGAGKCP